MRQNRDAYDDGDDRRAMVLKCFRCGARRPWCRQVWKSAIDVCGGTQDAAARRLFITTSAVSEGLQHGRLSIDILVLMMTELAPDGWRLPELPSRDEMRDEGLMEAMAYLRDPAKATGKRRRLGRDELVILAALHADKEWPAAMSSYQQAQAAGDLHVFAAPKPGWKSSPRVPLLSFRAAAARRSTKPRRNFASSAPPGSPHISNAKTPSHLTGLIRRASVSLADASGLPIRIL